MRQDLFHLLMVPFLLCGSDGWAQSIRTASPSSGPTVFGTLTVSNGTGIPTPGRIDVTNPGPALGYYIGGGTWYTTAIPYLRPDTANGSLAFDLMPNGNSASVWEDICSTDIVANSTNYECLHLSKLASGLGLIETTASGTGKARDIQIQPTATNSQRVIIGGDSSPTGKVEIVQGGYPIEANFGLSILSVTSDTALAFGAYAGNYSYIQSEIRGSSWTGRPLVLMPNGGTVGVGTTTPHSLLQVNGEVQVGSGGGSCATANNGAIRYSNGTLYYCTGTTWTALAVQ